MALVLCIGALPFVNNAGAYAKGGTQEESKYLDDYHKPVGLTYGVNVTLNAAYLWRGLYAGGPNVQASANVGFGGLYADVWCNIGADSWVFKRFQPEVDISLGFNRWGLKIYALYIHNFNCGFFDFNNYSANDGIGNRLELNARYTLSSKIPLSFLWATRLSAADGYIDINGRQVRAWSSYAELSYTHRFSHGISIYGAVGITPWRSCYTGYKGSFAVTNVDVRLRKDWDLNKYFGTMLMGQVTVNPYAISEDKNTIYWHPSDPGKQSINVNVAWGIYLR